MFKSICFQKSVHKTSFPKFTGKYWCWSLFLIKLKVQSSQLLLWLLWLWHRCFPVKFGKGKNTYFTEHLPEVVTWKVQQKKVFLQVSKNSQKNTWHEALQLYWKETPALAFSSKFCRIFRNTCFVEHLLTVTSDFRTAFSTQTRVKNNYVTRITQHVLFQFSEYGDTAVPCNIKTLYTIITPIRYLKMW